MSGRRAGLWGAVAHVFLAAALALPPVVSIGLLLLAFSADGQSQANRVVLVVLAVGFLAAVVVVGLAPPVRQVEVATARTLLALDLPDVVEPRSWAGRRRGLAWLGVLGVVGLGVAVALLFLLPYGVGLVGAALERPWLVAPGLLCLVVGVGVVPLAGALLRRWAAGMLGPLPEERLVVVQAAERELARRNTLARDLHDTIGHSLTAMTLQATAARRLLRTDPDAADRALAEVEAAGRSAQADVDSVVGALRGRREHVDEPVELRAALHLLAEAAPVATVFEPGPEVVVAAGTGDAVTGLVREGLTNAARHGTGEVRMQLSVVDGEVDVRLTNPAVDGAVATPGRHGLDGVRERVLIVGGTVTSGVDDGAWTLHARLPVDGRR